MDHAPRKKTSSPTRYKAIMVDHAELNDFLHKEAGMSLTNIDTLPWTAKMRILMQVLRDAKQEVSDYKSQVDTYYTLHGALPIKEDHTF